MSAVRPPINHPLIHSGTSQAERLLRGLTPDAFRLDERSTQDLIVAAHSYAQLLHYYNDVNFPEGDWTCFWTIEPLTFLAVLAAFDTDPLRQAYDDLDAQLDEPLPEDAPDDAQLQLFRRLVEHIFGVALRIEVAYNTLPPDHPLRAEIEALIQKNTNGLDPEQLVDALHTLIGYHKAVDDQLDQERYRPFIHDRWGLPDWDAYVGIKPDPTYERDDLRKLFQAFFLALVKIGRRADYWFNRTIESPELHQPHVALLLTFLYLFRHAQDSLNGLTFRHLEYYYEEILCLERRGEIPDEVHLLFELSKNFDTYFLEAGTRLLAGKDKNRRPLYYETVEDWVINKARVAQLKNTYLNSSYSTRVLAAPDAKAAYLDGEPIERSGQVRWRAMGDDRQLPAGDIGFAIASPQLILQEGRRKVSVAMQWSGVPSVELNGAHLGLQISTETELYPLSWDENDPQNVEDVFSFDLGLQLCLTELESARRLVADLSADAAKYLPRPGESPDPALAAIYNRSGGSLEFLNESVFFPAYRRIHGINQALERLEGQPTANPQLLAELYGLRAYLFWSLARIFVEPGLGFGTTGDPNALTQLPANWPGSPGEPLRFFTIGELYNERILSDLLQARDRWEQNPAPPELPRHHINYFAVLGLLSRLFLLRQEWAEANAVCDIIINSGNFALVSDVADLFTVANNSEIIWQTGPCPEPEAPLSDYSLYNWYNEQGVESSRRTIAADSNLESLYAVGNGGDDRFFEFYIETDDNDPLYPDTAELWNQKYYRLPQGGIILLRYSEILLNKAVALFGLGDQEGATAFLNQLRERASIQPFGTLTTQDILEERLRELAFEGDRLYALQVFQQSVPPGEDHPDPGSVTLEWNDPRLAYTPPTVAPDQVLEPGLDLQAEIGLDFPEDFPPIVHFDDDSPLSRSTKWPYLKFILDAENSAIHNDLLREASLQDITIRVEVENFSEHLIVQNDFGVFDGTQRVLPFGATPQLGSQFYLGSAEVFQKKIDALQINVKWVDPPNFTTHYQNYLPEDQLSLNPYLQIDALDRSAFTGDPAIRFFAPFTYGAVIPAGTEFPTITGRVVDQFGQPIVGASILAQGTTQGVVTASDGNYRINAASTDTLIFSNSGYTTRNVPVNGFAQIFVALYEDGFVPPSPANGNFPLIGASGEIEAAFSLTDLLSQRDVRVQELTKYSATVRRGFIRLTLNGSDFLNGDPYQRALALYAINATNSENPLAEPLPKAPYQPAINRISVDYVSTQTLFGPDGGDADQYFYLLPFDGSKAVDSPTTGAGAPVVDPYYPPTYSRDQAPERFLSHGNLYIGLENHTPGQNLALLVQVLEGTERELEVLPPRIIWSYLARNNTWRRFSPDRILRDDSVGLTRTGLVQLATPLDFTRENTLLDPGLYWIRASASDEPAVGNLPARSIGALPDLVDIRAQALLARFLNVNNEVSHLAQPLPPLTISRLSESRSAVKKVEQPFASFGGRLPEAGADFYRRVSERLRHRDRAVTLWDYERLVLEAYPKVQRAKCLTHTSLLSELDPGYVTVAVIPDLRQRSVLRAAPGFSFGDLTEMEYYLRGKTNLFVARIEAEGAPDENRYLRVVNPRYEALRLCLRVFFRPGVDVAYHRLKLDEELRRFLAPWLFDPEAAITFGAVLHQSTIIGFIERLPYVDAIGDFRVYHAAAGQAADLDTDPLPEDCRVPGDRIVPTTARSILTTFIKENKEPNETDHVILIAEQKSDVCVPKP